MSIEKLSPNTPDRTVQNVQRLAELFPECVTEGPIGTASDRGEPVIDFDLLRQALADHLVDGPQERFRLDWPGKREALLAANDPIDKTLRPMREESIAFETTENLFIEGDNLDALKLLQETYLGRVKMIYIDPPYNTGKDFIYKDDFSQGRAGYEVGSGQRDEAGGRLVANPETNGRFHSDWLNMMYPRLRLARNLLREDGAMFISINDVEVSALRQICAEIFGEKNVIGTIVWNNVTDNNPTNVASEHEYILVVSRDRNALDNVWKSTVSAVKDHLVEIGRELAAKYANQDELQRAYAKWYKENKYQLSPLDRYKYIDSGGIYTGSQSVHNPGREGYRYDVIHPDTGRPCKEPLLGYRFPKETMERLLAEKRIIFGKDHNKIIELKLYASDYADKLSSILKLDGRQGAYDLRSLFEEEVKVFDNPKPVTLVELLASFATDNDAIVVDFFGGSGTTAEAIFRLNETTGGARSWVMVQLPEPVEGEPPKTIASLSRERIRRAGAKLLKENPGLRGKLDVGFRAFQIDSSNLRDVRLSPSEAAQATLDGLISHIKDGRSDEDLLFGALLRWGVDVTLPIRQGDVLGRKVWFVDPPAKGEVGSALIACFVKPVDGSDGVSVDLADALAALKPVRVLFRDDGFANDAAKENVASRIRQRSPDTEVRVL
jgi:adenine-specific DNA-methyltransferase